MRYRDRWERWLRAHVESLAVPAGVDVVTMWAVAMMLASYASASGGDICVSVDAIRSTLGIRKEKVVRIVSWLDEAGIVVVVTKHCRGSPTQRALAIPEHE